MKRWKWILTLIVIVAIAAGAFFVGRLTAPAQDSTTFYAQIETIGENNILIQGLDINDINHRARFDFAKKDTIKLERRHTEITWEDLDAGDRIAVTYKGFVLETDPAGLTEVIKIQLLEDEK